MFDQRVFSPCSTISQERMAKIEQEEKEEHERKKREAEKKKHEIEVAEAMAKKRREEDVDDSKMVSIILHECLDFTDD